MFKYKTVVDDLISLVYALIMKHIKEENMAKWVGIAGYACVAIGVILGVIGLSI